MGDCNPAGSTGTDPAGDRDKAFQEARQTEQIKSGGTRGNQRQRPQIYGNKRFAQRALC